MSETDVPWTTARDHVDMLLLQLGVDGDSETAELSREYAETYDGEFRTPRGIALGAIYLGSLMANEKITQRELSRTAGCVERTIYLNYREIAEREGIGIDDRGRTDDDQDEKGIIAGAFGRWIR